MLCKFIRKLVFRIFTYYVPYEKTVRTNLKNKKTKQIYMNKTITLLTALLLTLFLSNIVNAQEYTKYIYIQKIENNTISYDLFGFRKLSSHSVDVTNLKIDERYYDAIKAKSISPETNIKTHLLSKGYAKLIDVNKAFKIEIDAENEAKQNKVGVWAETKTKITETIIEETAKITDFVDTTNLRIDKKYVDIIMSLPEEKKKREFILSMGYAQLNDLTKAIKTEIEAENEAREKQIGVWEPTTLQQIWNWIKKHIFSILSFIGLGSFILFFKKIKRWWIEKKINLLILGEPSAGKTALCKVLSDDDTTEDSILRLSATVAKRNYDGLVIRHGIYEFVSKMCDSPGAKYDLKSELINKDIKKAIIYVVSFTQENKGTNKDKDYMNVQLGALRAQIGQIVAIKNKHFYSKKPILFILFINKFDLLSTANPDDTSSAEIVKQIKEDFKQHIQAVQQSEIPYEIIIGSCSKKWKTSNIMDKIIRKIK